MPPLNEGTILYMPTTLPGISVTEAGRLLQTQDRILKSFPEVVSVFGKAGRAETSTDPAPFSMMETTVVLKPHVGVAATSRAGTPARAPEWLQALVLRHIWPDRISLGRTDRRDGRGPADSRARPTPGRCPSRRASTCSPRASARRSASRSSAPTSSEIEAIGTQLEEILRGVPGTRSVFAERAAGGYFVDFDLNREALARLRPVGRRRSRTSSCRPSAARTSRRRSRAARGSRSTCAIRAGLRDDLDQLGAGAGDDAVGRPDPAVARWRTSGP